MLACFKFLDEFFQALASIDLFAMWQYYQTLKTRLNRVNLSQ